MKIVDPDQLNQGTEVVITTGAKTIQLAIAGNLDDNPPGQTSGVTLQAVYSFLKEEWMSDASLNKFRFPIKAIYEAKFLMQNSWDWADTQSRDLIRDAGWQETGGDEYATIISLGLFDDDNADQAYYQNVAGFDQTAISFDKTGRLNEPIQILDYGVTDWRDFLKVYLREQGKTSDDYNLLTAQGYSALTYIAYRLPLSNQSDIKILYSDATITSSEPFISMQLQYYTGAYFATWSSSATYEKFEVVSASDGRWYRSLSSSNNDNNPSGSLEPTWWESYPGERQIGTNYYAFNRIVSGSDDNKPDAEEIYAFCQYRNRLTSSINDDPDGDSYGTVNGNVAVRLSYFVGDTLHSWPGTFFDNFDPNITNTITLHDITVDGGGLDTEHVPVTSTERTFPFVSAGNMVFNTDLVDDTDAQYWMYFSGAGGNYYDTSNAIIVNDADGNPITGSITQATISFTFDYDNNAQGGRTPATAAVVEVVAMGLSGAEWVVGEFTITRATGLNFPVNAATERNYYNP